MIYLKLSIVLPRWWLRNRLVEGIFETKPNLIIPILNSKRLANGTRKWVRHSDYICGNKIGDQKFMRLHETLYGMNSSIVNSLI